MISAYHDFNPTWTIMANAGWQEWSAFQKVSVALADVNSNQLTFANSYLDTWHVALGGEFHYTECFSYSAGIAYDTSAIKSRNRPLDFPIGEQFRIGTGFHWDATYHFSFDFSTTLQIQWDLKADVTRGETAGRVAGVFRNTYALFLNVNLSYCF
jgi:long-chain fatty acid transport protein